MSNTQRSLPQWKKIGSQIEPRSTSINGVIFPRLTTVERNALTNLSDSQLIFNTTDEKYQFYDFSTLSWKDIGTPATKITVSATAPSNPSVNDLWFDIS